MKSFPETNIVVEWDERWIVEGRGMQGTAEGSLVPILGPFMWHMAFTCILQWLCSSKIRPRVDKFPMVRRNANNDAGARLNQTPQRVPNHKSWDRARSRHGTISGSRQSIYLGPRQFYLRV